MLLFFFSPLGRDVITSLTHNGAKECKYWNDGVIFEQVEINAGIKVFCGSEGGEVDYYYGREFRKCCRADESPGDFIFQVMKLFRT